MSMVCLCIVLLLYFVRYCSVSTHCSFFVFNSAPVMFCGQLYYACSVSVYFSVLLLVPLYLCLGMSCSLCAVRCLLLCLLGYLACVIVVAIALAFVVGGDDFSIGAHF